MTAFFPTTLVSRDNNSLTKMDDFTSWSLVKVKKYFCNVDVNGESNKVLPSHEQKLLELITRESNQDVVDKGEFWRLLVDELSEEDKC